MPRIARIVLIRYPHHVTQRGNDRCEVFFSDGDRRTYLRLLKEEVDRQALDLIGYCLMPNHVHLLVIPRTPDSMAKAIGRTHFRYTQHVNREYGRSGHLWQNRFYSCPLEGAHFWRALAYIERNPVRSGLVRAAGDYPWSSARWHLGLESRDELLDKALWSEIAPRADWISVLTREESEEATNQLRSHTRTGRPLMHEQVLDDLERARGCRLRALPVGRPWWKRHPKEQEVIGDCP